MRPVRALIVDDSATMRGMIAAVLSRDPGIEVVGQAADPYQAREAIKALNPDVITLDVEMPRMDGLEFLEKIMRLRPLPVVMVSTRTSKGASTTIQALELGAVNCVCKPSIENPHTFDDLAQIVRDSATARVSQRRETVVRAREPLMTYAPDGKIVAIGASTGGVEALVAVISQYPGNCPPTVITLHMPEPFTKSFARRLNGLTDATVSEAEEGAPIVTGHVYLAPGGSHHLEVANHGRPVCRLRATDRVNGHRPSVSVLFHSVASVCGSNAVGVMLTGMGRDGADGMLEMRKAGARTVGQNEATSIVYGMPKVAMEIGAVEEQLPIHDIGRRILELTSRSRK